MYILYICFTFIYNIYFIYFTFIYIFSFYFSHFHFNTLPFVCFNVMYLQFIISFILIIHVL